METLDAVAAAVRAARKGQKLSINALAEQSGVSPRLIGEFERGQRPNVSLATVLRLMMLLQVRIAVEEPVASRRDMAGRAERAARRRQTWKGRLGTVADQDTPRPPASHRGRLRAVAESSRLVVGLQRAVRATR